MLRKVLFLCAFTSVIAVGCKKDGEALKETLRVSMIPTTDPSKLLREARPFVGFVEDATRSKVDLTIPTSYAAVVEALVNDTVDIAYLGGFTYVQASARAGVVPLVQREKDRAYHSLFITQADSPIKTLDDLSGHSFAFGDVNSTSGHLMPEYFMREAKVSPEVIDKALYSGGHDATALAVQNKKVDAGALDELVFQRLIKEQKIDPTKVRVFYTTPSFVDYIWVARKGLDPKIRAAFTDALMKLDAGDPKQKAVLEILSADHYVAADDALYGKLREAAKSAGLLK